MVVGGALRFIGGDWDDGAHLHPDERYLSLVAGAVDWPSSPAGHFDVEHSPLSPYNTDTGRSYVYGVLPLNATKGVAALAGRDSYDELYLVGRQLAGVVDTITILLVFLIARLLAGGRGRTAATTAGLLAGALYASAVTAIQHAHFFTVESWLALFSLVTFLLALLVLRAPPGTWRYVWLVAAAGAALGLAVAVKASGLFALLPVLIALAVSAGRRRTLVHADRVLAFVGGLGVVLLSAYVTLRLVAPYTFDASSWLDPTPSEELRSALEQQARAVDGEFLYPPAYQWLLSDRLVEPAVDEIVWGLGVPLGVAAVAALAWLAIRAGSEVVRRRVPDVAPVLLVVFVAAMFLYFGSRFAHTIRYLLPTVPLLCVAAAVGLVALHRWSALVGRVATIGVVGLTLLYAIAFTEIYREPHTRIAASKWIVANVPPGSTVVSEHWDDALPVQALNSGFTLRELPVFDADDNTKLRKLYDGLSDADLYALSSPRAWGTIGRLPDRFPIMVRFYAALSDGRLGFREAARFTSYPRLAGVELVDSEAEETFWVYDHPTVILYKRVEDLSWPRFRAALCRGRSLPGC